jgi:hypothetical protein
MSFVNPQEFNISPVVGSNKFNPITTGFLPTESTSVPSVSEVPVNSSEITYTFPHSNDFVEVIPDNNTEKNIVKVDHGVEPIKKTSFDNMAGGDENGSQGGITTEGPTSNISTEDTSTGTTSGLDTSEDTAQHYADSGKGLPAYGPGAGAFTTAFNVSQYGLESPIPAAISATPGIVAQQAGKGLISGTLQGAGVSPAIAGPLGSLGIAAISSGVQIASSPMTGFGLGNFGSSFINNLSFGLIGASVEDQENAQMIAEDLTTELASIGKDANLEAHIDQEDWGLEQGASEEAINTSIIAAQNVVQAEKNVVQAENVTIASLLEGSSPAKNAKMEEYVETEKENLDKAKEDLDKALEAQADSADGGISVVCTALKSHGIFDPLDYFEASNYGRILYRSDPDLMRGYWTIAAPFVWLIHRLPSHGSTSIKPIMHHMLLHITGKKSLLGSTIMKVMSPIARFIGRKQRSRKRNT